MPRNSLRGVAGGAPAAYRSGCTPQGGCTRPGRPSRAAREWRGALPSDRGRGPAAWRPGSRRRRAAGRGSRPAWSCPRWPSRWARVGTEGSASGRPVPRGLQRLARPFLNTEGIIYAGPSLCSPCEQLVTFAVFRMISQGSKVGKANQEDTPPSPVIYSAKTLH